MEITHILILPIIFLISIFFMQFLFDKEILINSLKNYFVTLPTFGFMNFAINLLFNNTIKSASTTTLLINNIMYYGLFVSTSLLLIFILTTIINDQTNLDVTNTFFSFFPVIYSVFTIIAFFDITTYKLPATLLYYVSLIALFISISIIASFFIVQFYESDNIYLKLTWLFLTFISSSVLLVTFGFFYFTNSIFIHFPIVIFIPAFSIFFFLELKDNIIF